MHIDLNFRAASELWRNSIKEYQCVDVSERMNDTAEFLLRGGGNCSQMTFLQPLKLTNFCLINRLIDSYTTMV